jgi:archaeoflavoprotein AfpA
MEGIVERHDVKVRVYLSKEGLLVVKKYGLWDELREHFPEAKVERGPNTPFLVGDLQLGKFDFLVLCPVTSNTVAKIAHGIADTLLTNAVAQALKTQVPVYIFPADQKPGSVKTLLPGGRELTLTMRDTDIENVERLRRMEGLYVLEYPGEIEKFVVRWCEKHQS